MSAQLDEIAAGVVVGRSGQALPLSKPHDNIFIHQQDGGQVPLSFLKEVIELFSSPGDWVLAGPTRIGMKKIGVQVCVCACMHTCVCVHACMRACVRVCVCGRWVGIYAYVCACMCVFVCKSVHKVNLRKIHC